MNGVGNRTFAPEWEISYAEFSTMLVRAYYEDALNAYTGSSDPWFRPYSTVAGEQGLYNKVMFLEDDPMFQMIDGANYPEKSCNRYDMAQIIYNLLVDYDAVPDYDPAEIRSRIGDWGRIAPLSTSTSVEAVFAAGIIGGVDANGTFNGDGVMTRAQAATVMCRMDEVIHGGGIVKPEDPEPTPDPEPGMLKNGKEATPENVIEMLKEIEESYPTGTVWTEPWENEDTLYNPNPVSETVGDKMEGLHGINSKYGCGGFAAMVSDLIFPEDMEMREVTDLSQVRPGDIVFNMDRNGNATHVWVALSESWYGEQSGFWQVDGRGEGNVSDGIMWGWGTAAMVRHEDEAPAGRGYQVVYTRYPD